VVDDGHEWPWLFSSFEPTTGEAFFLLPPGVGKEWLGLFLAEFAREVGGRRVGPVLDGSGGHRAELAWPAGVVPLPLPPYSPEPNPAEQVFRSLRAALANRVFADLAGLEAALADRLRAFWDEPAAPRRLTAYPWWRAGAAAIAPPSP